MMTENQLSSKNHFKWLSITDKMSQGEGDWHNSPLSRENCTKPMFYYLFPYGWRQGGGGRIGKYLRLLPLNTLFLCFPHTEILFQPLCQPIILKPIGRDCSLPSTQ